MNLQEVITELAAIEAGVTFNSGIVGAPTSIARVYPFFPKTAKFAVDLPCFMNRWTLIGVNRRANNQRRLSYIVRPQALVGKAEGESDVHAQVATAIHDAFMTAIDANLGLGTAAGWLRETRGEDETLALLEFNGLGYVGLAYEFEVDLYDVSSFGTGV